ncbi:hypothetical protein [Flagellimonas sp.]|uniref:hypothetical protein n=1 Tax=Flagellimonas sp. TaxID=2058762 RepID=UPI003B502A8D
MDNPVPIVVVGFNRPRSISRILESLSKAYYPNKNIPLIISIDKGDDNQEVLDIANNFEWLYGDKIVHNNPENLGLRKHIIQCGDLSLKYGSVLILEDDLYVSPNFYYYTVRALEFSDNKTYIGGISLYNHQTNVHTNDIFLALDDGYDNWYFQFASSWGQAWTEGQWKNFKDWYGENDVLPRSEAIPANVASWSDKSWLKFFIAFLIETNTYFLYPKLSLTTNFSDAGTHVNTNSTGYQVPLLSIKKENYNFSSIDSCKGIYNSFYENTTLANYLEIPKEELCIDLYGYQHLTSDRYWLTSKTVGYKIIKSFSRSLRPLELNIIENVQGNEFFLYDTSVIEKNDYKENRYGKIMYNLKHLNYYDLLYLFKVETKSKIKRLIQKVTSRF